MSVELPKDAEGREIPLDTTVLFDKDGEELCVKRIEFDPFKKEWDLAVRKDLPSRLIVYRRPCVVYLEKPAPPDSWEKLEEDLDRCIKEDCLCPYNPSEECSRCVLPIETENHCNSIALKEIKERIRKLRGESNV